MQPLPSIGFYTTHKQHSSKTLLVCFAVSAWLCILIFMLPSGLNLLFGPKNTKITLRPAPLRSTQNMKPIKPVTPKPYKKLPSPKPTLAKQPLPSYKLDIKPIDSPINLNPGRGDFRVDFNVNQQGLHTDTIFEIKQVDTPPTPLSRIIPVYPVNARARGIQGHVELVFRVNKKGEVKDITVLSSSPGDIFVKAALSAVTRWKYKPALKNSHPVEVKIQVPLSFKLEK